MEEIFYDDQRAKKGYLSLLEANTPMEEGDKDPYYEGGTCGGMRQERRVGFFGKEGMLEIFSILVEGRNELKSYE